jgi:hypothetical protein
MQMKMLVRIDVVERESARAIGFELRLDLRRQLAAHRRPQEDVDPETDHIAAEVPVGIDEIGQLLRGQDRPAFDQDQMQADVQPRQPPRPRDGVLRRGAGDHEACSGEDAVPMCGFDRLIDLAGKPEIVGGDDNALQSAGSRRSRRKRKNSMPSRSRRFRMSGLFTISPASAAILGARK